MASKRVVYAPSNVVKAGTPRNGTPAGIVKVKPGPSSLAKPSPSGAIWKPGSAA